MTMLRPVDDARPGTKVARDDVDIARDRVLVQRAQEGDRTAFEDLYGRYYRRLWRFCYKRLKDEHEAEDVVQDAFARAWRALPGFAGDRRFYPWISVIASHLCSNVLRKRNRVDPIGEFPDRHLLSWEDWGEDYVITSSEGEAAARAFARLPTRHQMVLDLRETRGWSYQRIAEHEGVRVSTIESLLWRAREALKREYAAESGTGMAGIVLFSIRRWMRGSQALVERATSLAPCSGPLLVSAAGVAASALAVVVAAGVPAILGGPSGAPRAAMGGSVSVVSLTGENAGFTTPGTLEQVSVIRSGGSVSRPGSSPTGTAVTSPIGGSSSMPAVAPPTTSVAAPRLPNAPSTGNLTTPNPGPLPTLPSPPSASVTAPAVPSPPPAPTWPAPGITSPVTSPTGLLPSGVAGVSLPTSSNTSPLPVSSPSSSTTPLPAPLTETGTPSL